MNRIESVFVITESIVVRGYITDRVVAVTYGFDVTLQFMKAFEKLAKEQNEEKYYCFTEWGVDYQFPVEEMEE